MEPLVAHQRVSAPRMEPLFVQFRSARRRHVGYSHHLIILQEHNGQGSTPSGSNGGSDNGGGTNTGGSTGGDNGGNSGGSTGGDDGGEGGEGGDME